MVIEEESEATTHSQTAGRARAVKEEFFLSLQKRVSRRILLLISVTAAVLIALSLTVFAATSSTSGGKTYYHPPYVQGSNYITFNGIDVSVFQRSINWQKVKKSGVDFAFIRVGGTYGKSAFTQYKDSNFITNIQNAQKAGVNVGVYYFSLAKTTTEAKKEAAWVVNQIEAAGLQPNMPVVMDYEFLSGSRLSTTSYGSTASVRSQLTANAKAFMNYIKDAGYTPMFYTYRNVADWSPRFNMDDLQDYPFWLAQYSTSNSYSKRVDYWQYSSSGSVSGISGRTDMDFYYYNTNGTGTESGTKSIRSCSVSIPYSQMAYSGYALEPKVTVKDGSKTLTEGDDYTIAYFKNVNKGTAYVVVNGIGDYSNTISKTFKISGKNVASASEKVTSLGKVNSMTTTARPSSGSVKVKFSSVANAQDYQITYKTNDGEWKNVLTGGATSYTLKLSQNDAAAIKVRAVYGSGSSAIYGDYSRTSYRYLGLAKISTVLNMNKEIAYVSWTPIQASQGTVSYSVSAVNSSGDADAQKYTGSDTTTRTISVEEGDDYTLRITPYLELNGQTYNGTHTGMDSYRLTSKCSAPTVTASSSGTSVKVSWNDVNADKYRVYVSTSSSASTPNAVTKTTTSTNATVSGLTPGKTYYVSVRPIDVSDHTYNGELSTRTPVTLSSSISRGASENEPAAPEKITKLSVTGSTSKAAATVKIGAVDGASDYQIAYRTNGGDWKTVSTGGKTTYTLTGSYGDRLEVKARAAASEDGKTVYSDYTGVKKRALLKQNKITSASSQAKGILKLNVKKMKYTGYYVKLTGNGTTKYYRFTNYKTTALTIKNLKAGTYKATVYNYTKSGSTTFNGCASKSVSVKVK
jgi:GH25 family lysozyme M1 (1,4-beta-N-acetylmuramidase)